MLVFSKHGVVGTSQGWMLLHVVAEALDCSKRDQGCSHQLDSIYMFEVIPQRPFWLLKLLFNQQIFAESHNVSITVGCCS